MTARSAYGAVIVGGGVVGTTAAFSLMRRGIRVALVERSEIGQGTTARSFAWINASSKTADKSYHRLNAMGAAIYQELADAYGVDATGLHRTGMLQCISHENTAGYAALQEQAAQLERFGYPHAMLEVTAIRSLEPDLTLPDDLTAIHALTEGWLDAPRFTRFLADQIQAAGSDVFEHCSATALEMTDGGAVTGLVTDQGTLATQKVLLAAGHETPGILSELTGYQAFASRFPMSRVPGLLVTTPERQAGNALRHIIYFDGGHGPFHIRPAGSGALRLGADDTDGMISEDSSPARLLEAAACLLDLARQRVPELIGNITPDQCDLAVGVRPYPQDGKTLAGALPGSEGLFVIATHSGITLAPALGRLMATCMIDGMVEEALAPFSLERFPGFS